MAVHTTRPDQVDPRCWRDPGQPWPAGDVQPWDEVIDTEQARFDCEACIEDVRNHARPRWLDELLFPTPEASDGR